MSGKPVETWSMACHDASCDFKPIPLQRRPVGEYDVLIDMKYCGVCHSDLHTAADHLKGLGKTQYPCVPGHELAGVCTAVGAKVSKVKVGDHIGVGCMVDSCMNCSACKSGEEQNCTKQVGTYNGKDFHGRATSYPAGKKTFGGYTSKMVVHEDFAINIPKDYPLEFAGPVMCAGITMYDPMRRQGIKAGDRVGIVGLGGLGQMGVRIAKALGCEVTVISRSDSKRAFAQECGAEYFVASSDNKQMEEQANTIDLILNTVPVYHDYCQYNSLLKKQGGRQVLLGLHVGLAGAMVVNKVTCNRSRLLHSAIGGIAATQEIIDLCAEKKIYPKIKISRASELNQIYETLDKSNDEGIRYVLDIENTLNEQTQKECEGIPAPKIAPAAEGQITPFGAVKEAAWLFFTGKWW